MKNRLILSVRFPRERPGPPNGRANGVSLAVLGWNAQTPGATPAAVWLDHHQACCAPSHARCHEVSETAVQIQPRGSQLSLHQAGMKRVMSLG